jgi:hypothetical protein
VSDFNVLSKGQAPKPKSNRSGIDWAAAAHVLSEGHVISFPKGVTDVSAAHSSLRYYGVRVRCWHVGDTFYIEAKS